MPRRLRIFLLAAGCLAMLAAIVLLGLYLAARYEPAFYREAKGIEPKVLEEGSDAMLRQTAALVSAVKNKKDWETLFTAEQLNGWLAVDLPANHPSALPATFHDPRVAVDSKRVTIACRFERGWVDSVLSLTIEPSVTEPNVLALRIVRARAGLLPLPLNQVLDAVKQVAVALDCDLQWRHVGGDPVAMLSFPADDDQRARVTTLRLGKGKIYVAGSVK